MKSKIYFLFKEHKEIIFFGIFLMFVSIICEPNRVGVSMIVLLAITCLIMIIESKISDAEDKKLLGKKHGDEYYNKKFKICPKGLIMTREQLIDELKKLKNIKIYIREEYISIYFPENKYSFDYFVTKQLFYSDDVSGYMCNIAENRTPEQVLTIIKALTI